MSDRREVHKHEEEYVREINENTYFIPWFLKPMETNPYLPPKQSYVMSKKFIKYKILGSRMYKDQKNNGGIYISHMGIMEEEGYIFDSTPVDPKLICCKVVSVHSNGVIVKTTTDNVNSEYYPYGRILEKILKLFPKNAKISNSFVGNFTLDDPDLKWLKFIVNLRFSKEVNYGFDFDNGNLFGETESSEL